ncbi:SDR family oxidoreductase [Legionella hackeliae]|uniref:Oxidoreductase n=1 Tax=Legionella hackeliae TaxID=449 RepID=A0A0A8UW60_LEGHA|nr:SDR family oxidoreductase [Legionella hackeliae]KTD09933.1 3-hydroxybutyrate dehydrogenase [Legionella hackeliae]CEK11766.1 Oxidoreductase [Legionella hackeliae]STX48537.1 3-hydroxybutyrate dehydrogenase [Legionella hackeliae]
MSNYFANKVIWITGASSGIGEALALALAQENTCLVLSARREEELSRVAKMCQEKKAETLVLPMDLSSFDTFEACTQLVLETFKRIDILILNAGISGYGRVVKVPFWAEQELFNVNFLSTIALTKAVLPSMLDNKKGQIIAIASALAYIEYPERAPYAASKHAMLGYFHSLGFEVEGHGLHVGVVCPGFVKTSLGKKAFNEQGKPCNVENPGQKEGLAVDVCAQKIIKSIKKRKREVYIGRYEPWVIRLRRHFPRVYFSMLSFIWRHWQKKLKEKI